MKHVVAPVLAAATLMLVGCASTQPNIQKASFPSSQRVQIGYAKSAHPNHEQPVYMLVAPQGNRWVIERVSGSMPQRTHARQEIILTNTDLRTWTFPLRSVVDYCPTKQTVSWQDEYSLCNSVLGEKSGLGNAILIAGSAGTHPTRQYDTNRQLARAIVNSIAQEEVDTKVLRFVQERQQREAQARQQQEEWKQAQERQLALARQQQQERQARESHAAYLRQQEANARRKAQEEKIIAEARKHPIGTEDRCLYKGKLRALGEGPEPIQCTFTTLDNTDLLTRAGWIIVNSQTNSYGNVVAYVIRKVR